MAGARLTPHDSMYEDCVLFHKMNYYKAPQYLDELIPKNCRYTI